MGEGFGFGTTSGTVVDETTVPQEATGGEPSDFQFDEPQSGGKYPPRITPGPVRVRFEAVELREKDNNADPAKQSLHKLANGKVPLIIYNAHVQVAALAPGRLLRDKGDSELTIRFNEASGFKSQKMKDGGVPSGIERLYAAMGLLVEFGKPKSVDQMVEMIRNAGAARMGDAKLGWSAAVKLGVGKYEVYSTDPKSQKGAKPFSRDANGALPTEITFSNGEVRTAREGIVELIPPKPAKKL